MLYRAGENPSTREEGRGFGMTRRSPRSRSTHALPSSIFLAACCLACCGDRALDTPRIPSVWISPPKSRRSVLIFSAGRVCHRGTLQMEYGNTSGGMVIQQSCAAVLPLIKDVEPGDELALSLRPYAGPARRFSATVPALSREKLDIKHINVVRGGRSALVELRGTAPSGYQVALGALKTQAAAFSGEGPDGRFELSVQADPADALYLFARSTRQDVATACFELGLGRP